MSQRLSGTANPVLDRIDTVRFRHGDVHSVVATVLPGSTDDVTSVLVQLKRILAEHEAEALEMRVFASASLSTAFHQALQRDFGRIEWPVTFVGNERCPLSGGIQVRAVSGTSVETVRIGGRPVGRTFEDGHARYCVLGDLRPAAPSIPRTDQVREVIERLEEALGRVGMSFQHVVRTWFFIRDILDWYTEFNVVRDDEYSARGVFERYVPASTGIGGQIADGAALMASALAMEGRGDNLTIEEVTSPLQCSARDYGSSFSRAAEVAAPEYRCVFVSGTASIDPFGRTVHAGSAEAQVGRTLEVVGAILESRGMAFSDVVRANAYFRHAKDGARLTDRVVGSGLAASRLVVSSNAVCRDDLLFELEVDAVRPSTGAGQVRPGPATPDTGNREYGT